jgi:hypothetical protein
MGFLDDHGNLRPEVLASLKTIPQGAATTVWVATSTLLDNIGGVYCEDGDIAGLICDSPSAESGARHHQSGVMAYSLDAAKAQQLWTLTEEMTGIEFDVN